MARLELSALSVSLDPVESVGWFIPPWSPIVPGRLVDVVFWVGMMIAMTVVFLAVYQGNRFLLRRGQGHALTHDYARRPS